MKYYLSSKLTYEWESGFWMSDRYHMLCRKSARKILGMKKRFNYQLLLTSEEIPGSICVHLKRNAGKIHWKKPGGKWDNMSEDAENILDPFMDSVGFDDRGVIFVRPFKVS